MVFFQAMQIALAETKTKTEGGTNEWDGEGDHAGHQPNTHPIISRYNRASAHRYCMKNACWPCLHPWRGRLLRREAFFSSCSSCCLLSQSDGSISLWPCLKGKKRHLWMKVVFKRVPFKSCLVSNFDGTSQERNLPGFLTNTSRHGFGWFGFQMTSTCGLFA